MRDIWSCWSQNAGDHHCPPCLNSHESSRRPLDLGSAFSSSPLSLYHFVMGSSRGGREKKHELSDQVLKIRQRLHEALSLGIRFCDSKVGRWKCLDAESQSHALRTMDAFMESISSAHMHHPLVKESIQDMLVALGGILQSGNEKILSLAMKVITKLVSTLRSYIHHYDMVNVVFSLSCLLALSQIQSALTLSCVIVLNCILTSLRSENYMEVWKVLEDTNIVGNISLALQNYMVGISPSEYFKQNASLLKTILWKWPPSRCRVWSNNDLMGELGERFSDPDSSITVSVLQLCSTLALCGNGAIKLLENKEILSKIVWALGSSRAYNVRAEALKVCRHLLRSQEGCNKLTSVHCDSIVQGIVSAMREWHSSDSGKTSTDQMILVKEACKSALMARWAGRHHSNFWKLEVDRILLRVLIGRTNTYFENQNAFHPGDVITEICNSSIEIRPYIWDILGGLAVHCSDDFIPESRWKLECLDALINIACSAANELWCKGKTCLSFDLHEVEPVSRVVLLMVFSPCKYISLQAREYMSEVVRDYGGEYLGKLLDSLILIYGADDSPASDSPQTVINLISLACYSTLPPYQQLIVQKRGAEILTVIIKRCLNTEIHISRSSFASHLHDASDGKLCCWRNVEDWEGQDLILFHSLQSLSQLVPLSFIHSHPMIISRDYVISNISGDSEAEALLKSLRSILDNSFSTGARWYAQYILSFFGLYGFPSKFGERMEVALSENELSDLQFLLSSGQDFKVHGAILMAGCPYLLPPKEAFMKTNMLGGGSFKQFCQHGTNFRHGVKMSERVDSFALVKILEYVYTGFIIVEDDNVKPVFILAKRCGLNSLSYMLSRKLPEWGTYIPSCGFIKVLESTEHHLSDIILEANEMSGGSWSCTRCVLTVPHLHAHKIILWSNCDYLRALFQSGMHESFSEVVKIPIGYEALNKLVEWFYTGKLPRINLDCNWKSMTTDDQLHVLQAYVELSWLAEFWFLKEVGEESFNMVHLCLELNQKLSMELINFASDLHQWRILEVAVTNIAPLYPKMRDCGDLENFSDQVVDLLRSKYVRHRQIGFSTYA